MKILLSLSFILYSGFAFSAVAETSNNYNCSELRNTCEYYTCIETQKQCGPSGYLQSFGYKYCHRFQDEIAQNLSPAGRVWLHEVRSCLIDELSKISPQTGCYNLKKLAFRSHIPCYQKTSFCNLKKWDKYHVLKALKSELKSFQVFKAGLKILRSCRWIRFY